MGIPLLGGRDFDAYDGGTEKSNVAIVDQSFARRYWPGANPIGKDIRIRDEKDWRGQWRRSVGLDQWKTVVGVALDVANRGSDRAIEPGVYIPYNKWKISQYFILVRSGVDSTAIVGPIRFELRKLNPDLGMFFPMTMTEVVQRFILDRRLMQDQAGRMRSRPHLAPPGRW